MLICGNKHAWKRVCVVNVPKKQIVVVCALAELPQSAEGARVIKSIFAATAKAKQPTHEDLRPTN